jgi:phenylacetate-coenzyme A ligase PaaK-like adenylate-forming protein
MLAIENLLTREPYSLSQLSKNQLMLEMMLDLTDHHMQSCVPYKNILQATGFNNSTIKTVEDLPYLPVRLFKHLDLKSIDNAKVVKMMVSSGTTGQQVSKIYLDATTAANQRKILVKIVSDFIGKTRLPMLILDSPAIMGKNANFTARTAGVLGFSIFSTDRCYALDEQMNISWDTIDTFLQKHHGKPILLFGFTYVVWQYLCKKMQEESKFIQIPNGILIHGGGWKKLKDQAVSSDEFKQGIQATLGISSVFDYYGMIEQTGCIYMQCAKGYYHSSIFSDVLIRRIHDFSLAPYKEEGLIQVISMMPRSYPGHSLLTEDIGVIMGVDDCACGRLGNYFLIKGRLAHAEIRGCSDTQQ